MLRGSRAQQLLLLPCALQQLPRDLWAVCSTAAACAGQQASGSSSGGDGDGSWRRRRYASAAAREPGEAAALKQAAHELGLDAVSLQQLKELMATGQQQVGRDSVTVVSRGTANTRKLVWGDLPGYHALLEQLAVTPEVYDLPKAPALDAGQWVNTHMKEVGLGMEVRGDFYVWRAWSAANLPPDQHETMLAMAEVMGDETSRAALIKQSQHELARLWDWQHRRAALGLSPDLPPSAAAGAAGSATSAPAGAAAAAAAGGSVPPPRRIDADAAAAVAALDALEEREQVPEASSSSSDLSGADEQAQRSADDAPASTKTLMEVLALGEEQDDDSATAAASTATAAAVAADGDNAAAAAAAAAAEALLGGSSSSSSARLAAWGVPPVEDVVDEAAKPQNNKVLRKWASQPASHAFALKQVREKLERGRMTATRGKNRYMAGVPVRQYNPVGDDDDTFLPAKPFGSKHVAAALADPSATRPVNPTKVVAQATAVAAAARRAAAATAAAAAATPSSPESLAAAALAQGGGGGGGGSDDLSSVEDMAAWSSMPLLDRSLLHEEQIRQAAEKLAGAAAAAGLLSDGYTFDLEQRPPTPAFDLLTAYLEVRYADVLLRKDSVLTMQRQLALRSLQDSGAGRLTELLEQPPAALTAGRTLSPQERQAVSDTLNSLLSSKQYEGYRQAVLQLYCDGLIAWGELQECWAAAQSAQELTAAAEAPVDGLADDRQRLFGFLSGGQQLQDLSTAASQPSSPADKAAARAAWQEAGSKLQANWAAAAGSSSDGQSWAGEPVSYEEAAAAWQQLLTLAGQVNGPRFDQVLLQVAGGSEADALQQQLRHLQAALERATGLPGSSLEAVKLFDSSSSSVSELEAQLQPLFAAPSLEQLMQQHWAQVAKEELGQEPDSSSADAAAAAAPSWGQLSSLLQQLTHTSGQQQQQQEAAEDAAGAPDAAALFERHLREADGVPLTPPPYPGARRLLRWEQRLVLHAASGETVLPAELKVKLSVSAAELAQEAGLSSRALEYLLAVAGSRYNAATGVLTIACDRFPTREENRRWCLEALHKLLQAAQGRCPSASFALDSSSYV